jgi:hypothetical protein
MSVVARIPKVTERLFPEEIAISWERGPTLPSIVDAGKIDAYVASARAYRERHADTVWLAGALGRPAGEIVELAQRCEEESDRITLAVLPSRHGCSALRGIVLVPSTESSAYAPFHRGFDTPTALWSDPSRDFVYAVAWEALAAAEERLGAKRVGIAHFTAGRGHRGVRFDSIVAACMVEALAHRCARQPPSALEAAVFLGHCGCIEQHHIENGVRLVRQDRRLGNHRPIEACVESRGTGILITLAVEPHTGRCR